MCVTFIACNGIRSLRKEKRPCRQTKKREIIFRKVKDIWQMIGYYYRIIYYLRMICSFYEHAMEHFLLPQNRNYGLFVCQFLPLSQRRWIEQSNTSRESNAYTMNNSFIFSPDNIMPVTLVVIVSSLCESDIIEKTMVQAVFMSLGSFFAHTFPFLVCQMNWNLRTMLYAKNLPSLNVCQVRSEAPTLRKNWPFNPIQIASLCISIGSNFYSHFHLHRKVFNSFGEC